LRASDIFSPGVTKFCGGCRGVAAFRAHTHTRHTIKHHLASNGAGAHILNAAAEGRRGEEEERRRKWWPSSSFYPLFFYIFLSFALSQHRYHGGIAVCAELRTL
jgi:hypothetical protein